MSISERIQTADENDNFVALIQAAIENFMMCRTILAIVQLDSFNRASLLATYIYSLRLRDAPYELIEALNYLRDDAIAARTKEVLFNESTVRD